MSEFNYLREKRRMLDSLGRTGDLCEGVDCVSCPLSKLNNKAGYGCSDFEMECPDEATETIKKWAEEHEEPEVDWSKIPIDTPVLVDDNRFRGGDEFWVKRHFAGVDKKGNPLVYSNGRSSWSNAIKPMAVQCDEIKLAKVEPKPQGEIFDED